jgi:hypothetical protein
VEGWVYSLIQVVYLISKRDMEKADAKQSVVELQV